MTAVRLLVLFLSLLVGSTVAAADGTPIDLTTRMVAVASDVASAGIGADAAPGLRAQLERDRAAAAADPARAGCWT